MARNMDVVASGMMFAESAAQPLHVGGLQLFTLPDDAGPDYARGVVEAFHDTGALTPMLARRPHRGWGTLGRWIWDEDREFDIEHHVRHSSLPKPGRIRELLSLCSNLHGTLLDRQRPLWETHVIEGLNDGRLAVYTKIHHAVVDGIAALRLVNGVLTDDPGRRNMPYLPQQAVRRRKEIRLAAPAAAPGVGLKELREVPAKAVRSALSIATEAAGMSGAAAKTLVRGLRDESGSLSFSTPKSMFNVNITASRRFAAQDWEIERMHAIGKASGTTINDVVLAMCAGALRRYLQDHRALPDASLTAMVPVGLKVRQRDDENGGNAFGAVVVNLGTDLDDPADRLARVARSMAEGKEALRSMTPAQTLAMAALGMAPALAWPMLRLNGIVRPPYNLVISNVPGPRQTLYANGARMDGLYPLSLPMHGQALNITCVSYDGRMGFGLIGCRRSVPHVQHLLAYLDDELEMLEKVTAA